MKKTRLFFVTLCFTALAAIPLSAQTKAEKAEQTANAVKSAIESNDYIIEVNQAIPMSGRSINLTTPYSLTVRGDSVYSYLPYFGRAYSVPYGGGDGLNFNATLTDYSVEPGRKESTEISFKTRTREDQYVYRIRVFPNGATSINVSGNNRQGITFSGELRTESPEKSGK